MQGTLLNNTAVIIVVGTWNPTENGRYCYISGIFDGTIIIWKSHTAQSDIENCQNKVDK